MYFNSICIFSKTGAGTSGKSVADLEKTVVLMKKVVERVQRENEALKKAPGVVTNQKLDNLKQENKMLKVGDINCAVKCTLLCSLFSY